MSTTSQPQPQPTGDRTAPHRFPVTSTLVPLDPRVDVTDDLPDIQDPMFTEPDLLSPVDTQAVRRLHRIAGPGPHLDQLTDDEQAALMDHLARITAAIDRHRAGEPEGDDWPFPIDSMADTLDAYLYRGTTPDLGDDPPELDYDVLSDFAADLLEGVKSSWVERAEAYSAKRPL